MPLKPFFDTNVLVYAFLSTDPRHGTARALAAGGGVFSVQVANEFVDVARRKMRWEWDDVVAMLAAFRAWFGTPVALTHETHVLAIEVARRVPVCAMTTPWNSSGTSITSSSTGSMRTPSIAFVTISGRETCSS